MFDEEAHCFMRHDVMEFAYEDVPYDDASYDDALLNEGFIEWFRGMIW